jgi:superfamily II DNA or RNA helicase
MPPPYLGRKGYTVLKSSITAREQERIRKDLTVAPRSAGVSYGTPDPFFVYRESERKIYLPRCYGTEHLGPPSRSVHPGGSPATMVFQGVLRPAQEEAATKYLAHVEGGGSGLLDLYCGFGKTVIGLAIAARLGLKTLIIVHKDFLVDQWVERIEQFLPTTRVGRIQAKVMVTEGCDIVVGMLQSIASKDYPADTWDQFGFTIIDECHHMSAEGFSNALFKVITPYMLGLSATMTRKDGLTKVFKSFLGKIVMKKTRQGDAGVRVFRHDFSSSDEEFGRTELDFRGQIRYAAMISKVHGFGPRTDFVGALIVKMVNAEDKGRQALVLAQNRCLLVDLMKVMEKHGISAGFYLGGMRKDALADTSTKRVILATYGMAEEALDIKGLNTLVLASPRTSIEQAVGRILRQTDGRPVVHDIVDQHETFQRQWKKRLSNYRRLKYTVEHPCAGELAASTASGFVPGVCYV